MSSSLSVDRPLHQPVLDPDRNTLASAGTINDATLTQVPGPLIRITAAATLALSCTLKPQYRTPMTPHFKFSRDAPSSP